MSNRCRNVFLAFLIFAGLALLAGCGVIAYRVWSNKEEERILLEQERAEKELLAAVYLNNEDMPDTYRKFAAENPDVYAWLEIPGTDISYPILQRKGDGSFYLTHNALGQESPAGGIFTEDYNSKDFSDPVTVLYGNRMEDGSMFGALLEYEDEEFFDAHKQVFIYTPDSTFQYSIFAAYCGDDSHLLLSRDLSKAANREAYIREVFQNRGLKVHLDSSISVTEEDHILALSTGYPGESGKRFLIQAVMIQNNK